MRSYSFQCVMACVCVAGVAFTSSAEARSHRHRVHHSGVHHVRAHHTAYSHHRQRVYSARRFDQREQFASFNNSLGDDQRGFLRRDAMRQQNRLGGREMISERRSGRGMRSFADRAASASFGYAGGSSELVDIARRYIGTNPTGWASVWCGRFMNLVLKRSGLPGTGSNLARSFAHYGHRVPGPRIGAIAVMARRGGGHVGVVSGIDEHGNPILISGNHNHRVAEAVYPRGRIYAYVMPN